jgi:hypothetical protein
MTIDELGALGEFLGSILVLITLVYLTVQIRQNTKSVQASTELDFLSAWNQLSYFRAESPELMDLYRRGGAGYQNLEDDEIGRFEHLCYSQFNIYQAGFHQHRRGILADDVWEAQERNLALALEAPGIRTWLEKSLPRYSEPFGEYVTEQLSKAIS